MCDVFHPRQVKLVNLKTALVILRANVLSLSFLLIMRIRNVRSLLYQATEDVIIEDSECEFEDEDNEGEEEEWMNDPKYFLIKSNLFSLLSFSFITVSYTHLTLPTILLV